MTFCLLVHVICFILACILLVACFVPRLAARIRLMEAIIGTAVVAYLCVNF
jgi:hypothetical protein